MRIYILVLVICLLSGKEVAFSQDNPVLLRINGKEVLRSEFEYAYKKELSSSGQLSKKELNELVDGFVVNKLKIAEAEALRLDTAQAFRSEVAQHQRINIRRQYFDAKLEGILPGLTDKQNKQDEQVEQVLVSQLIKYLPQNTPLIMQRQVANRMDSLYRVLERNPRMDFSALVNTWSDEKNPTWIRRNQTPKEVENQLFSLPEGGISKPFQSPLGWHIVKVQDKKVSAKNEDTQKRRSEIDNRQFLEQIKAAYGYKANQPGINELFKERKTNRLLFSLNGKEYTGKDFERFSGESARNIRRQYDRFVVKSILDLATIESGNKQPENKIHYQAFRDSLLLHKITEIKLEQKSREKAGLQAYFSSHKKHYKWEEPRFRGAIIHCDSKKTAKKVKKLIKKKPEEQWESLIRKYFNTAKTPVVVVEQGLFAEGDSPYTDKLVFKKGSFTPVKGYPYTDVIGKKSKNPETIEEAGNSLQSDYRHFLESLWLSELCRNSKVEINQEVLKTVNKH